MNIKLGILSIIMCLLTLFFSPVIYESYFKYFNIKESAGYQMCIVMFLALLMLGFIASAIYNFNQNQQP